MELRKKIQKLLKKRQVKSDMEIILEHGVNVGQNVSVYGHNFDLDYGPLLFIGNNVTISQSIILLHDASPNKFINNGGTKVRKVQIGDNVFIGYGSIILPGTVINDNVIVGAGTVVRGEIPPNSVIIGNPWQKICSFDDYINHHKDAKARGVLYQGNDFSYVAQMIDEGKDVYI